MAMACLLRVTEDRGWRVLAWDRSGRPVEGRIDDPGPLIERVRLAMAVQPRVILPGRDAAMSRAEEDAGRALAAVLAPVASVLAFVRGRARERRETMVLLVDVDSAHLRSLPWELIGEEAPIEATGGLVARLADGHPHRRVSAEALTVGRWCPTPNDPACAALIARQDASAARIGLGRPLSVASRSTVAEVSVLHLVCHGARLGDAVNLVLGEGDLAHSTAAHSLAPHLRAARLVVLDVCESANDTPRQLDNLAARVIAAGAEACLAPGGPASIEATAAVGEALWSALASGDDLATAVQKARADVRALAIAHPDSRWHNHRLTVASPDVLEAAAPVERSWRPEGWPRPAPDARALLSATAAIAAELGSGFVGVEHVALALERWPGGSGAARMLRLLCPRAELRAGLAALTPIEVTGLDLRGTPRLRRLMPREGFDGEELLRTLLADPHSPLTDLTGAQDLSRMLTVANASATLGSLSELQEPSRAVPATRLEVVGGPEDGRLLRVHPGDTVGRWGDAEPPTHALYADTAVTDRRLSRRHLRWEGPGRVTCLRRSSVRRNRADRAVEGEIELLAGDVLVLSPGTRLRAE